jgi:transcriptional regulator with XRE-family HTH domain
VSLIESDFAARLRARMEELEVTVPALAALCGEAFSVRTIFRWRSGQSAPGIEALPLLARALDTSCDWLLGVDHHPHQ